MEKDHDKKKEQARKAPAKVAPLIPPKLKLPMAPPMAPANGPKTAPRNFTVPPVNEVVKNARDFCPDSAMFYVVTKKEFDKELWNEIKTSWLEPGSTIPKETVWKLVHQLRLESVKATSIENEDLKACQYVAEAEELELVFSTPYQIAGCNKKRSPHYWNV